LDEPLVIQYVDWLGGLLRLDLGESAFSRRSVRSDLGERLPRTVELAFLSMACATLIGVTLGILSAVRRDKPEDLLVRTVSVGGLCLPVFWFALLGLVLLARLFQWIPPVRYESLWEDPLSNLSQMALPATVLGFYQAAALSRLTRSAMLEVLGREFVRTARAKGLLERTVLVRHALRNAALPILTLAAAQLTHLLNGAVVIEHIFAIPGVGSYLLQGVAQRDYEVVQGTVMVYGVLVIALNLMVDLLYMRLDPRVRAV
jgi:peptide/nickel transport system permease protein